MAILPRTFRGSARSPPVAQHGAPFGPALGIASTVAPKRPTADPARISRKGAPVPPRRKAGQIYGEFQKFRRNSAIRRICCPARAVARWFVSVAMSITRCTYSSGTS